MKTIQLPNVTIFHMSRKSKILFYLIWPLLIGVGLFALSGEIPNDWFWLFILFQCSIIWLGCYFLWQTTIILTLSEKSIKRTSILWKKEIYFDQIIGFEDKHRGHIYVLKIKSKKTSIFIHGHFENKSTLRNWVSKNFTHLGSML